jgi:hypothetical protein
MNNSRDPLYSVLQASERTNRRRQSIRAVLILLALVAIGVLLKLWGDAIYYR